MSPIPETHKDLFDLPIVWHVATVGPNGAPHVSPVWADFDGTFVRFPHQAGRQKWRNLNTDNRVALSATDPEHPERYLEIRGRLVEWETENALEFLDRMAKKYRGEERFPRERMYAERVTGVVAPEHCTTMG